MLLLMPVGTQTSFDRKSHRRIQTRTVRLTYTFYAARFLGNRSPDEIAEDVLEHLEDAQALVRDAWGRSEWKRLLTARLWIWIQLPRKVCAFCWASQPTTRSRNYPCKRSPMNTRPGDRRAGPPGADRGLTASLFWG